jgi:hypothetical protein
VACGSSAGACIGGGRGGAEPVGRFDCRCRRQPYDADPRHKESQAIPLVADAFAGALTRARRGAGNTAKSAKSKIWLPFLDTYRTMCLAPQPDFRRVLEDVLAMQLAA